MSDLDKRDCTLAGGVVTGSFNVGGRTSAELEPRARTVAAQFADGRPWSIEINADAVMRGDGAVVSWVGKCEVTVVHVLREEASS